LPASRFPFDLADAGSIRHEDHGAVVVRFEIFDLRLIEISTVFPQTALLSPATYTLKSRRNLIILIEDFGPSGAAPGAPAMSILVHRPSFPFTPFVFPLRHY
jgi:hypothetical protein